MDEADTAFHAGRLRDPTATLLAEEDPNRVTIGIEFEDDGNPTGVQRPDVQYRAGAALIAAAAQRWGISLDREHVVGHRELFAAKLCPGNLDLDRLIAEAAAVRGGERPLLALLLPAGNSARDLPGYLESAAHCADAVIALDDGSTDRTREILESSSLVKTVLANPRREGYSGWDDAANRERLLEAASQLDPHWVAFLDADERLDTEDGRALRRFLQTDALPGCAYGFELHRMWGEGRAVDGFTWVFRLFAHGPGLTLPPRRLHFNPVPVQIPRRAWIRSTIRVRHLDSPQRLAQRRAKYEQSDPERAHERRPARLLEAPDPERLVEWRPRDPATPVLDPDRVAARLAREDSDAATVGKPPALRLVCLLPVRNGERDLPGYLESVERFADAVIALDDGSTDGTREILDSSDLVEVVLSNPRREGYAGWDDAANRTTLLDEAVRRGVDWALWLDADERIDPDDAAALRGFIEGEPDPAVVYGFRVFRMIGGLDRYDQAGLWAYRLFSPHPGQELPDRRLHLVPIPISIPATDYQRTTVRIQHLAGLDAARRLQRYAKYEQADPQRRYQREYSGLLQRATDTKEWQPRPPGLPVLVDPLGRGATEELDVEQLSGDAPVLSAIVISRNDEDRIETAVRSVVEQECSQPFEVIVVVSGTDRTAEIVRKRFPEVTLVELEGTALPGRARNAGVAAARGEYVSFPGSHVELPPGSLAARIAAHELGYAMVTGSILNGTPTRSGWASYFLDHSGALPGRPSAELEVPPAHCSYVREFLLEAGGFPADLRAGEDTVVNTRLFHNGHRAYRSQEVHLVHRSRCEGPWRLVRHHFTRGQSWGRILTRRDLGGGVRVRKFLLFSYVPTRFRRAGRQVREWGGDLVPHYRRVRPLVLAGVVAAWAGLLSELLRPGPGLRMLIGPPRRAPGEASANQDGHPVDLGLDGVVTKGGEGPAGPDSRQLLERERVR